MFSVSSRLHEDVDLFSTLTPGVLSVKVSLHSKLINEYHLDPFVLQHQVEIDELELEVDADLKGIGIEDLVGFMVGHLQILLHVSPYRVPYRYLDIG